MKDFLDRKRDTILMKVCVKLKVAGAAEVGLDDVCQELEGFFCFMYFIYFSEI